MEARIAGNRGSRREVRADRGPARGGEAASGACRLVRRAQLPALGHRSRPRRRSCLRGSRRSEPARRRELGSLHASRVPGECVHPPPRRQPRASGRPPARAGVLPTAGEEKFARGRDSPSRTYWDYDEATRGLTYWLFYPGSAPPLGILRAGEQLEGPRPRKCRKSSRRPTRRRSSRSSSARTPAWHERQTPAKRGSVGDVLQRLRVVSEGVRALLRDDNVLHEGDWERITVYLDENDPEGALPASVAFYRHSTNTFRPWSKVEKDSTHPVAYCAIGSHASLPSWDFGYIDVGDRDGPRWKTFEDLTHIVDEAWYGFGGAWGRLGKVRDSTGPLGPGALEAPGSTAGDRLAVSAEFAALRRRKVVITCARL